MAKLMYEPFSVFFTSYYEEPEIVTLCCFEHFGVDVTNPYISECGRCDVDPTIYYGLSQEELDEINRCNSKYYEASFIE